MNFKNFYISFALLIFCVIILIGCVNVNEEILITSKKSHIYKHVNDYIVYEVNGFEVNLFRDTIDEHVYYIMTKKFDIEMIHSEDCPCKK